MRNSLLAGAALIVASTAAQAETINVVSAFGQAPQASGDFSVTETLNGINGVYDVSNGTTGSVMGFGVSNNDTIPVLFDDGSADSFGCGNPSNGFLICYESLVLNETNWDEEIAQFPFDETETIQTFQDIFGDFATVSGGDNTFNWFWAVDGDLQAGDSIDGFFGFQGLAVASSVIGVISTFDPQGGGGATWFTAGQATVPGGPTNPSPVPLPAAGWMLIAGLGGLAAMGRRRKA